MHLAALEGVYTGEDAATLRFHETRAPSLLDIETIALRLAARVRTLLRRRGLLSKDGDAVPSESDEPTPEAQLAQAAMNDRIPAGALGHCGRFEPKARRAIPSRPLRLSDTEGFSVDASVRIDAGDTLGRTRVVRYSTRPAFSDEQFTKTPDGRVAFAMRKPRRDGTTHLSFSPLQLLRRISWLIIPPKQCLVRYQGVLAPAARLRRFVVPASAASDHENTGEDSSLPILPGLKSTARRAWATLVTRVYGFDPFACPTPRCPGRLIRVATITQTPIIRRILEHLGLPTEWPPLAPARAPPQP